MLERLLRSRLSERENLPLGLDDWASMWSAFQFNGVSYPILSYGGVTSGNREEIGQGFAAYTQGAYRSNGVVFACMGLRLRIFSEARFQFRRLGKTGRPSEMFGTPELDILAHPWERATTGDLLARAMQDVDLAGNFFCTRRKSPGDPPYGHLRRLRPDWVTIVAGSPRDDSVTLDSVDAELIGYVYHPRGPYADTKPVVLMPEQVCHFAPIPDPLFTFRGMSWLQPIIREVMGDSGMTSHKIKFLEQGATVNLAVSMDPAVTKQQFDLWKEAFEKNHAGLLNAYKTLFLGGGATVTPVGTNLRQMDFAEVQSHGETRIAAAAGCPPILVGLSEGLSSGTFSNFSQAVRSFGDGCMRPLWRNFSGSMEGLIKLPGGAYLTYDDRDIAYLRADQQDEATIRQTQAATIASLVNAGYKPESVVPAVIGGDFSQLTHSGLYSVQLQPPGELGEPGGPTTEPVAPAVPAPGNGKAPVAEPG